MDIRNKTVLVLGGWGLVGNAVIRKLVPEKPKQIIVTSLRKEEAIDEVNKLQKEFSELPKDYFVPWWGNIFIRNEFKDMNRFDLLNDPEKRKVIMMDTMEELNDEILHGSAIFQLLNQFKPEIIVDAINSATGIAYQDVYSTYYRIKKTISTTNSVEELAAETEKLMCTMYIPQLIRHVQILYNSMSHAGTQIYFKIGTSGTGGMGLNIPYTHSEEKPSRVLLSKSSVAGAHTLLLFLMGRTPDGPITKEIKPTGAIAWKRIEFGEIKKGGKPIHLLNVSFNESIDLKDKFKIKLDNKFESTGETLKSIFIDTGENGTFSRGEFEAITAQGQMEYVTPEEIAVDAIREIMGGNTGHDIINALDNATLEPTYRAGFMQHAAAEKLAELENIHNINSVAFELLGPPRLSKLLHEINILKLICGNFKKILSENPKDLSTKAYELLSKDSKLRNEIISIGIPILKPDGKSLLRGNDIKIPPFKGENEIEISTENIDLWAKDGWVDLRESSMHQWQKRIETIVSEAEAINFDDTSSMHVRTKKYWNNFETIDIGKVVGWIFIKEEKGERMKA